MPNNQCNLLIKPRLYKNIRYIYNNFVSLSTESGKFKI